jgi:carbamoylphosphate synthase large subunit
MLGAVCMEVLHSWRPNGPAALLRLSNNEEAVEAARAMIQRLGLSGLCGFDFMVEHKTGRTYLIEINARATQTCHLPLGRPHNPVPSLMAAVAGKPMLDPNPAIRSETVALFPLAWQSGISKEMLDSTYRDIPWEEPRLVQAGFAESEQSFYEKGVRMLSRVRMPRAEAGKVDA